ncbi:polyprenyl synthetase family protein [Xylocopilactobacillus apicola]|uniref:Farnesyl diphosphate synthase n=1 Tax=Xylocopilactobacillus apicola TaxID=2932184 RepID=A0AAU9DSC4_9LACO|nr:polyprenyl synthetase family protein [Xylocopilactobacillus apicola]BDR58148.1 hypothetical protein XA3_05890 [Xylocopilactobacillus apicola]
MMKELISHFNEYLTDLYSKKKINPRLKEAINYSLLASGKRLRPLLFFTILQSFGREENKKNFAPAAAIEMVHTYSLIHDDLPAMDNDNLRRGKPTNHVVFGEDLAILAGDALLTDAFWVIAESEFSSQQKANFSRSLAQAAGSLNMVSGQVEDLLMNQANDLAIKQMHYHKTAAMFVAAGEFAAIALELDAIKTKALKDFAANFGMAFQLADDLADFKSEADDSNNFVADFGVEQSLKTKMDYRQKAFIALNQLESPEPLKKFLDLVN